MAAEVHELDGRVGGHADVDVGVEVLELGERCLGPRDLADVIEAAVEVPAHILNGDGVGVVDGDLLGPSEDQILGNLDSQLDRMRTTPVTPWMNTRSDISLPCASWPYTASCLDSAF